MPKLSVVIITLNEERNIARCLDSVKDIADEIVVVDSFSADRTQEICTRYDVTFIQHPFENYISQKNIAIDAASNDWILSLDADEALSEVLRDSIIKVKENPVHDAYFMSRLTNYCGKWIYHCGWYPDTKLRLFNRLKARWSGHLIHEKIEIPKNSTIEKLQGDLIHYSYYSISDHIKQADTFSSLSAREMFEKGKSSGLLKIFLSPKIKFFRDYIVKLGFLDGYYGYVICKISSHAAFLKYVKLQQLQKKQS